MAKPLRILQCNLNRSRLAHDLAQTTVIEMGIYLIVASEPNKKEIQKDDCAKNITSNAGFVTIRMTNVNIYGCYVSPNIPLKDYKKYIEEVMSEVTKERTNTIVMGDLNSKATDWGSPLLMPGDKFSRNGSLD